MRDADVGLEPVLAIRLPTRDSQVRHPIIDQERYIRICRPAPPRPALSIRLPRTCPHLPYTCPNTTHTCSRQPSRPS